MTRWEAIDSLLAVAQQLVEEIREVNDDKYRLLESVHDHIIAARGDLDADLK